MKLVNENFNFKRGEDPHEKLNLGKHNIFNNIKYNAILTEPDTLEWEWEYNSMYGLLNLSDKIYFSTQLQFKDFTSVVPDLAALMSIIDLNHITHKEHIDEDVFEMEWILSKEDFNKLNKNIPALTSSELSMIQDLKEEYGEEYDHNDGDLVPVYLKNNRIV